MNLAEQIADAVREHIAAKVAPLERRIVDLEAKAAKTFTYEGVWSATKQYESGAATTHQGSLWIAKCSTLNAKPGTCPDWQLAVKRPPKE